MSHTMKYSFCDKNKNFLKDCNACLSYLPRLTSELNFHTNKNEDRTTYKSVYCQNNLYRLKMKIKLVLKLQNSHQSLIFVLLRLLMKK